MGAAAAFPFWMFAAPAIASMAGSIFGGGGSKEDASDVAFRNQQAWYANAFPSAATIAAQKAEGRADAVGARSSAYENLARNLSVRGIGPNSPYSSGKASQIERGFMDNLSNLENNLIKQANTPRFGYPFETYTPTSSASSGNPLTSALGALGLASLLGKGGSTAAKGSSSGDVFAGARGGISDAGAVGSEFYAPGNYGTW